MNGHQTGHAAHTLNIHSISARIQPPQLKPSLERNDTLAGRMIDFGITLKRDDITRAAYRLIETLPAAPTASFNQTCLSEVIQTPIAVNVETKAEGGDQDEALAQLTVWIYAQYRRLRLLVHEAGGNIKKNNVSDGSGSTCPLSMPVLPSLIAVGASWHVYFFWMDASERFVSTNEMLW